MLLIEKLKKLKQTTSLDESVDKNSTIKFKIVISGKNKIDTDDLNFVLQNKGTISDIKYIGENTIIIIEIDAVDEFLLRVIIKYLIEECDYSVLEIENAGEDSVYSKKVIETANKYLDRYSNENKISGWVHFYNRKYKFNGKEYNNYADTDNKILADKWAKEMGGIEGAENFYNKYIYKKTIDEFINECDKLVKKGSIITGLKIEGMNKNAKKYQYIIKAMKNRYNVKNEFIKGHFE